jgi:hypothetical protein
VSEAPDTVVARVIEDGPMAAGPVVYLYAGTRNFATLICRCMNSQAKEVAAQDEYVLTRLNADSRVPRFPPGYRLSDWLRLPESF